MIGGQGRNRTADASLFRAALYRLSYLAFGGGSFSLPNRIFHFQKEWRGPSNPVAET
jgi:hypothetical protein